MDRTDLENKIDRLLEIVPVIEALGAVLVRRQEVIDRVGLNKNTLNGKEKYEEIGARRTYISIDEIPVIKRQKKRKKRV